MQILLQQLLPSVAESKRSLLFVSHPLFFHYWTISDAVGMNGFVKDLKKKKIEISNTSLKENHHCGMILAMSSFTRIITLFLVFYQS